MADTLVADVGPHDTEVVLCNTIQNIGIEYRDSNGNPATPASISLLITDLNGNEILEDTYLPDADRDPDPPRILNPSTGRYDFPLGLDNGLTSTAADPNKNRSDTRTDYLFTWKAKAIAAVAANVSIDPSVNTDDIIVWTAVVAGTPGNFISIEYIDPGVSDSPLSLTRNGAIIEVSLATNVGGFIISTADDVIAAVIADDDVSEIVTTTLPGGGVGTGILAATGPTLLTNGSDATEEVIICKNVKVISHRVCSLLSRLRLIIDKALKYISQNPDSPCFLGYSDGQLLTYLEGGLQIINSYQPSGSFTIDNFPYQAYEFILIETSLIAGVMSQQLFAIDTDIPNWNDQGNTFVIQHQPQLATFLNALLGRLDKLIPMFKLNFVNSGALHIQAGPNFRLTQLINAAPSGALFRNMFFRG
jgi:hypothetical protein